MSTTKGDETSFKAHYAALNAAQKQAVDTIEGPVMVIAGPGTGKTQILTLRIANILLQTDVAPSNILAITFTDFGAKNMRSRLQKMIGDRAYDVSITTFHAFADKLVRQYPEAYTKIIGGRAASEIERIQIIEQILSNTNFKAVRPHGDPSYYVRPLLRAIQSLKQENVTTDRFKAAVLEQAQSLAGIEQYHLTGAHKGKERGEYKEAKKHLERNQELQQVYIEYEALMRDKKLYDFDDMILETVRALESNEDMLRDLQEQYQYVLADEHQDVNGAQNRILELLVSFHERPNIFVVGDEKQAIYRFQGASLENFLYFEDVFAQPTLISLTENYRSGPTILEASHEIIKTDDEALAQLRVPLKAVARKEADVVLAEFPHTVIESAWVVDQINNDLEAGIPAGEIAVIVRTNREVEEFAAALRKKGITVTASADSDILDHPLLGAVQDLIAVCVNPNDLALLTRVVHQSYWNYQSTDLGAVFKQVSRHNPLSKVLASVEALDTAGVASDSSLRKILPLLQDLKKRSLSTTPHRMVELLLVESGLVDHVLKTDPEEGVRVLRRIYDEVEGMVERKEVANLSDVVNQFTLHRNYQVPLPAPFISYGKEAVQVMTAHKAKGMEYEVVYVPHACDKTWGGKANRDLFRLPIVRYDTRDTDLSEEDERRLFYVAMTRAKAKLVLTAANTSVTGKEQILSRFVGHIPTDLINQYDTESYCKEFSPVATFTGLVPVRATEELMITVLSERGLSPTALNNYLKSPWEYFFRNVLQIPQIKTTELQFGTAVHATLDILVRQYPTETIEQWLTRTPQLLKQSLDKEAISDEEFSRLHERGMAALTVYLPQFNATKVIDSKTEYHLEAVLPTGLAEYPELKLNGNLDRVDFVDGKIVQVVDYKTGKPKTRNHIEGKTTTSNGDYKRQLVFYALLLSLQPNQDLHCRTGVLSFVESDNNGQIKEEIFEITDQEIAELTAELIRVNKEIVSGAALTQICDPEQCNHCDLIDVWISS